MFTKLKSVEEMNEWLRLRRIDTTQWGTIIGTKTIRDLWEETIAGESVLEDHPPVRMVQVVKCIIRKGARVLVEIQHNRNNMPLGYGIKLPSEKIKRGETPTEAAIRGLKEELNIALEDIKIICNETDVSEEARESKSYPGLHSNYMLYLFYIEVRNLPDHPFYTEEVQTGRRLSPIRHEWLWI